MADANWESDSDAREEGPEYTLDATQEGVDSKHLDMMGELVRNEGIETHGIFLSLIDGLAHCKEEYEKAKAAPPGSEEAKKAFFAEQWLAKEIDGFAQTWIHRSKRYGRGYWRRWGRVKVTNRESLDKKVAKHAKLSYKKRLFHAVEEMSDGE